MHSLVHSWCFERLTSFQQDVFISCLPLRVMVDEHEEHPDAPGGESAEQDAVPQAKFTAIIDAVVKRMLASHS